MKQLSGTKSRPKYRLSPNEVEQLKKEETERRRKLRIVQVREQSKNAAAKIRNDVQQERKRQLVKLAKEVEGQLQEEKQEEVKRLEQRYDNTLRSIGQGHTQAMVTDKATSHAEQQCVVLENKQRADERHKEALRRLELDKAYKEYEETKHIRDRQAALMEEKKRAAEIAALPPPPPDPINDALLEKCKLKKAIPMTDMTAFSTTHFHIPDFAVEKAPLEQQQDAKSAGEEEDLRTKEEISERKKKQHDQIVRARIRGSEALKKEMLKHDYDALMADLSLQQRHDRRRRQQVVDKIPKQVFLPADRRIEEMDDKQMEMERAFEDMYMQQINISGDFSLTLEPNPIPQTPVDGEDDSMTASDDSPLVIPTMPTINPALREVTNVSRTQGQTTQEGKPETVLKKLLNRIKEQRSEVESEGSQQLKTSQEHLEYQKKGFGDRGPKVPAARQPVAKPTADPDLDLSPLRAPGNRKPQKSPVGKAAQMESELESESAMSASADTETGFLDQLQGRIHAIEAQRDMLDQKMRDRLQQQEMMNLGGVKQPQPQPGDARLRQPTYQPPTYPTTVTTHPTYFPTSAQPARKANGVSVPGVAVSGTGVPVSALSTGDAGDLAMTGSDLLKRTEYGQNLRQETSGESTMGMGSSAQTLGFGASAQNLGFGAQNLGFGSSAQTLGFGVSTQNAGLLYSQVPLSSQMPFSSQSGFPSVSVPQSFSGIPAPAQSRGVGVFGGGGGASTSAAQGFGMGGGGGGMGGGVSEFSRNVGFSQSAGVPLPSSSIPHQQPTSSSAFASVPSSSYPAHSYLSSVLGNVQPQPISSFQPLPSSVTAQTSQFGRPLSSSLPHPRSALTDTGDSGFAGTLTNEARPDFGSLAARLAAGLPEQERLQRLRDYQRHLVEKHQERMQSLQDVRARIESRQAESSAAPVNPASVLSQASSILSTTSSVLSTSQRMADPASLVPYTLKTSSFQQSGTTTTSSSSFLPAYTGVSASENLGLSSRFGLASTSLSSGGPLSSAGYTGAGTFSSAGYFPEPILAGSAGVAVASAAGLVAGTKQPVSASFGGAVREEKRKQDAGGEVAGSRRSSGGSSHKLDGVRKSLPFDNPDVSLRRDEGDGEDLSLNDDSRISSSTDRGSPALGSRSYKSSTSGKSGSGLSEGSGGSISGSSLVARAEEKRISFENRQQELQGQLAEIQRQKDALLQRYQGSQQQVTTQEEELRRKLKSAQALSASASSENAASAPLGGAFASAVSLGVHQSFSPSMELEEGSLSSERLGGRASVSSERLGGMSNSKSWAMELEEYSLNRSGGSGGGGGGRDKGAGGDYRSPGSMTLEEFSITSDYSGGKDGKGRGEGREFSSGGVIPRSAAADRSANDTRPLSSLSSLEEYSITNSRVFMDVRGSQENLSTGKIPDPDSARDRLELRDLMVDLLADGNYFAEGSEVGESSRLPPPPTRQAVPVAEYEPHELSTILEVDTPQTGAKSAAMIPRLSPDGGDRASSRRYIDFARHGVVLPEDDKFSASGGSSASSDVRSVIEVRPGMLRTGTAAGGAGTESGTRPGMETRSGMDTRTGTETRSGISEGSSSGMHSRRGDETLFRDNVPDSSTAKGQGFSHMAPLSDKGDNWRSSQSPRDVDASVSSSTQGYLPLEMTLDSLTSQSISVEDVRTTPRETTRNRTAEMAGTSRDGGDSLQAQNSRSYGSDVSRSQSFGADNSRSFGGDNSESTDESRGGGGGVGRGSGSDRGRVDDVLRQARQFNEDMMQAIQRQAADVFDQSSLSSMTTPGDNTQGSL